MNSSVDMKLLTRKRDLRIVFPVFLVSIIACLDRVNISYAALTTRLAHAGDLRRGREHFLLRLSAARDSGLAHRGALLRVEVDRAHHVHLGPRLLLHGVHEHAV